MKEFDIENYKKVKNEVKQMFRNAKLGNQQYYPNQEKLFQPIIDTTRETTKNREQKLDDGRLKLSDALVLFTNQLMRANDQREALPGMPFYTVYESQKKTLKKYKEISKKVRAAVSS